MYFRWLLYTHLKHKIMQQKNKKKQNNLVLFLKEPFKNYTNLLLPLLFPLRFLQVPENKTTIDSYYHNYRHYKAEFLKRINTWTHILAQFSRICANFTFEHKISKSGT